MFNFRNIFGNSFKEKIHRIIIFLVMITMILVLFGKSSHSGVLTTSDFSCDGMTGFTFKYPIFEGWEPAYTRKLSAIDNDCIIFLNRPLGLSFETQSRIAVTKRMYGESGYMNEIPTQAKSKSPNPQGIPYIYTEDPKIGKHVTFYTNDFMVFVEVHSVLDKAGFSLDLFFKTVIESFQIQ